jgi:hypothetical protein
MRLNAFKLILKMRGFAGSNWKPNQKTTKQTRDKIEVSAN